MFFERPLVFLLVLLPLSGFFLFVRLRKNPLGGLPFFFVSSLALRFLALCLLLGALAGFYLSRNLPGSKVVFVLDNSESLPVPAREEGESFVEAQKKGMGDDDRFAVVRFGKDAVLEQDFQPKNYRSSGRAGVDPSGSDIYGALLRGLGLFGPEGKKRMVLLSDGRGDANPDPREAARAAYQAGVPVDVYFLGNRGGEPDVAAKTILLPAETKAGERHKLSAVLASRTDSRVLLSLYKDGVLWQEQRLELSAGENVFDYTSFFDSPGLHRYEIRVSSSSDSDPGNNSYTAAIRVLGEPEFLYVSSRPEREAGNSAFVRALEVQKIKLDPRPVSRFPQSLSELSRYEGVILDNVPAYDFSYAALDLLETFVGQTGGGLLMLGGEHSFGAGAYYSNSLEKVLPLDSDSDTSLQVPNLAMLFVIDRSGSMAQQAGKLTKLELIKQALVSSADAMNPNHFLGILSFDSGFSWTLPFTPAGDRQKILDALSGLGTGGGTDLYPALEEALRVFSRYQAALKHLIILSDGQTGIGNFEILARRINRAGISITTIAVGEDANTELMKELSQVGKGRYYFTKDIGTVPLLFSSEAYLVSRDLIRKQIFLPVMTDFHPILQGIDPGTFPPLDSFVLTYPKPQAQTPLTASKNAPLLSVMKYGLGRSAAFTSNFGESWGPAWASWKDFPRFSAQLVRWIQRPQVLGGFSAEFPSQNLVKLEIRDVEGNFVNLLDLRATFPGSGSLALEQDAPGSYLLDLGRLGPRRGDLDFSVHETRGKLSPRFFSVPQNYSQEHSLVESDGRLLLELASLSGGRVLDQNSPSVFSLDSERGDIPAFDDYSWLLALLALLLFLGDLAVRTLAAPDRERFRFSSRRGQRASGAKLSYSDLLKQLRDQEEEELRKKSLVEMERYRAVMDHEIDNYLYLARLRQEKRQNEK